jgi:16S rRNA (uracil1498-N3)-methyltransferase
MLFDGNGTEGQGAIREISSAHVLIDVSKVAAIPFEQPIRLTVATAVPRTHRQHFLVEKCTELGAYAIQPLLCERSVVRPGDPLVPKWTRIAIEAAKQSQRAWLPRIEPPRSLADAVACSGAFDLSLLLSPAPDAAALTDLLASRPDCRTMVAWIGPEGGFSDEETELVIRAGAKPTRLGPTILRIETAAVAMTAAIAIMAQATEIRRRSDQPR